MTCWIGAVVVQLHHDREACYDLPFGPPDLCRTRPGWQDSVAAISTFLVEMQMTGAGKNRYAGSIGRELQSGERAMEADNFAGGRRHRCLRLDPSRVSIPITGRPKKSVDDRALNRYVWTELCQPCRRPEAISPRTSLSSAPAWHSWRE